MLTLLTHIPLRLGRGRCRLGGEGTLKTQPVSAPGPVFLAKTEAVGARREYRLYTGLK